MTAEDYTNLLKNKELVSVDEYLEIYKSRIIQESEELFVRDFLYPLFGGNNMTYVIPQYPFIDSEGRARRIDFGIIYENRKVALEVNGETYHAEGVIAGEAFDDNLNRQNEILNAGWYLLRFSYSQLKSPQWRPKVQHDLRNLLAKRIPEVILSKDITPNPIQEKVLKDLDYYRSLGWKKGVVVLPTGIGKTYLSAFDSLKVEGKVLFVVHRLDILSQAKESFEHLYKGQTLGLLTGEEKISVHDSKVLFASKDTLRGCLEDFDRHEFDYVIIDEVHHGSAPSYKSILNYFDSNFFTLGLTATPDRMDRKDIFELFDYKKIAEYSLNDAIDNGFLVPYTYYGLTDNIDYSNIRYNGRKYNVEDLDRKLIIKERNEQILDEYLSKGNGNKALGFCCSITHANAMTELFNSKGIAAVSITSETLDRDTVIANFRDNKYIVAFTVDLFNEGVDFPDLRVLLFLRPTESKTVFLQQLGRGLRLCGGKERVVVIDFIGNYKKANNIRKYLSKQQSKKRNPQTGRIEKIEYEYSPKCEVKFDAEVEEILDNQDTSERDIAKEDLLDAYYTLKETLNRKPSQEDINAKGEFKVAKYLAIYGTWVKFLREIGEFTESSFHFPQGTHLGHILYILKTVGTGTIKNSHVDEQYVRFSGNLTPGVDIFQRQTKYKLQAAMEMGILEDFREDTSAENIPLILTSKGSLLYESLKPLLEKIDFSFNNSGKTEISWTMSCEKTINQSILQFINSNPDAKQILCDIFMNMDAVYLMLRYLYGVRKVAHLTKADIYSNFFNSPEVQSYLDYHGIDTPTLEGAKHRLPFLFNILESMGILNQERSTIDILKFVASPEVVRFNRDESIETLKLRCEKIRNDWQGLDAADTAELKTMFGADFLTKKYYLTIE